MGQMIGMVRFIHDIALLGNAIKKNLKKRF